MAKLPDQMINEKIREELRELIEEVVRETVRDLKAESMLRRADDVAYGEITARLYEYFKAPEKDPEMRAALERIKGDYYSRILIDYYRDKLGIDWIAENYGCELSTIKRNKKRLCLKLYNLLK